MELQRKPSPQGGLSTAPRTTLRVLVIEDDELDFIAVKRLLDRPEGNCIFEVFQAASVAEGFRTLAAHAFDIALVDYFLGPACGLDLVRRLGGRHANIPIVVLTGSRDPQIVAEILESGVTNYLCKEFLDGEQLRRVLQGAIQQHRLELELLRNAGVLIDRSAPIPGLGYFDFQVDSGVLLWSRESYAIWGVTPGEFTPTTESVRSLIHPDDRARFIDGLTAASTVNDLEFRVLLKGGGERTVHTIINRLRDVNAQPMRIHGVYHDVTAQRKAEEKLHSQQRKYQMLFDNSDVALLLADCSELMAELEDLTSSGVDVRARFEQDKAFFDRITKLFRVMDVNRAADAMFGGESRAIVEANLQMQVRESLVREFAVGMMHKAPSIRSELIIETATGPRSTVFSLPIPVSYQEAKYVPVSIVDLTDVQNAEIANRANAAKSAFLARMSHELRTPLNGVVANIELMQGTNLTGEQASLVNSARLSADTLLHLIGDILDFSKIEAGKVELEQIAFNLPDLVLEIEGMFRARAISQGVNFLWQVEGAVPEVAKGDPLRVKQVLINLVGNALRYTKEGGVYVRLSASPMPDGQSMLRFDVIDSGLGLDPATSGHIFHPFEQADASTTRTHGGTGLGLAICKSLVELWNGEIGLDGAMGVGANFWFTVPVGVVEPAPILNMDDLRNTLGDLMSGITMFILLSPDRTDQVLQQRLATEWPVAHAYFTSADDLYRAIEEYDPSAKQRPQCIIQESPTNGIPPGIVREISARKAGCSLHLYKDDVRNIQRGLRAGFSAFQSPEADISTQTRNVMVVMKQFRQKDQRAIANFGAAMGSVDEDQLAQIKDLLRILILEDQPMNQLVIERQMSRLGLRHDVVEHGLLGLQRMEKIPYNLILCDCSMPHMDGFEFTRAVRAKEKEAGKARIPIIALTANAFTEDIERCHAAGMDDFLSKPVKLESLASKILAWARSGIAATVDTKSVEPAVADDDNPVDATVLPEAIGTDDPESLSVAYRLFVSELAKHVQRMETYIVNRSAADLNRTAHGAKGDARNAGAKKLGDLMQDMETTAMSSDWDRANAIYEQIVAERIRVVEFVEQRLLTNMESAA